MQQSPSGPFRDADFLNLWKPIFGCVKTDLSKPNTHFLRFGCDLKDYLRTIPDFCSVFTTFALVLVHSAQFHQIHERIPRKHILQKFQISQNCPRMFKIWQIPENPIWESSVNITIHFIVLCYFYLTTMLTL